MLIRNMILVVGIGLVSYACSNSDSDLAPSSTPPSACARKVKSNPLIDQWKLDKCVDAMPHQVCNADMQEALFGDVSRAIAVEVSSHLSPNHEALTCAQLAEKYDSENEDELGVDQETNEAKGACARYARNSPFGAYTLDGCETAIQEQVCSYLNEEHIFGSSSDHRLID